MPSTQLNSEWIKGSAIAQAADFSAAHGKIYLVDNGANTVDVQLPASKVDNPIVIKHTGANLETFALRILPPGGADIDGVAGPLTINSRLSSTVLVSDGTDWFII